MFDEFDVSDFIGYLRTGPNVLAIQGLNVSVDDGDLLIVPELSATVSGGDG